MCIRDRFLTVLVVFELFRRREMRLRQVLSLAGIGVAGSVASFLLYYRGFVAMVTDIVPRMLGGVQGATSRYPVRGWLEVAYGRTRDFFDGIYPVLTVLGLAPSLRGGGASLLLAWLATYLLLLLGRAKLPDVFLHGHETLFVTPLVCLVSGAFLGRWIRLRGLRQAAALLVLASLVAQGLFFQWRAVAAQLLPIPE